MKSLMELKCPRCGAELEAEEDREILFCQYCGAKIILTDENTFTINKTIRTIDDADITRAETDRIVQMHNIEKDKKQFLRNIIIYLLKAIASVFLGLGAISGLSIDIKMSFMCIVLIVLIWNIQNIFKK